jgi:hypothetical protein
MIAALVVLAGSAAGAAGFRDAAEERRIGRLIEAVETLPGAQFIRNGTAHDGKAAADHLKRKLNAAGDRVRTAEDFIRLCASRSSLTGEPYRIRLADGTIQDAEVFFRGRLGVGRREP